MPTGNVFTALLWTQVLYSFTAPCGLGGGGEPRHDPSSLYSTPSTKRPKAKADAAPEDDGMLMYAAVDHSEHDAAAAAAASSTLQHDDGQVMYSSMAPAEPLGNAHTDNNNNNDADASRQSGNIFQVGICS